MLDQTWGYLKRLPISIQWRNVVALRTIFHCREEDNTARKCLIY